MGKSKGIWTRHTGKKEINNRKRSSKKSVSRKRDQRQCGALIEWLYNKNQLY